MARQTLAQQYRQILATEWKWFRNHGGSEAAYVERYGSKNDAEYFGSGGELIFAADLNALRRKHKDVENFRFGKSPRRALPFPGHDCTICFSEEYA